MSRIVSLAPGCRVVLLNRGRHRAGATGYIVRLKRGKERQNTYDGKLIGCQFDGDDQIIYYRKDELRAEAKERKLQAGNGNRRRSGTSDVPRPAHQDVRTHPCRRRF